MIPKETIYKSYRFRSRLEARWAVFFDKLNIVWEYEFDGYDLNGKSYSYLPDFWLPTQEYFVEIKGAHPTRDEENKARLLALNLNKKVLLFYGSIWIPGVDDTYQNDRYGGGEVIETIEKGAYCYDPSDVSLIVDDTASPCYGAGWEHIAPGEDYCTGCGKTKCAASCEIYPPGTIEDEDYGDIHLSPQQAHLIRAVYMAETLSPYGDSCKLRLDRQGKLQYLVPQYEPNPISGGKQNRYKGRAPGPMPKCISEHKQEFEKLLATKPNTCEWGMGGVGILYNEPCYRWRECPLCQKLWITSSGEFEKFPCYKDHINRGEINASIGYKPSEVDRTWDLLNAYEAARQARFEHGAQP